MNIEHLKAKDCQLLQMILKLKQGDWTEEESSLYYKLQPKQIFKAEIVFSLDMTEYEEHTKEEAIELLEKVFEAGDRFCIELIKVDKIEYDFTTN